LSHSNGLWYTWYLIIGSLNTQGAHSAPYRPLIGPGCHYTKEDFLVLCPNSKSRPRPVIHGTPAEPDLVAINPCIESRNTATVTVADRNGLSSSGAQGWFSLVLSVFRMEDSSHHQLRVCTSVSVANLCTSSCLCLLCWCDSAARHTNTRVEVGRTLDK